jgi:HlyD family secretion protein
MKRTMLLVLAVVVGSGLSAAAFFGLRGSNSGVHFETRPVTRGALVANVVSSGTVEAVDTVEVGTQANGIVKELNADFNSVVRKGEVLARLDPSVIQAQIVQGEAGVAQSTAGMEADQVRLEDAERQLARARELLDEHLMAESDFEVAQVTARQAAAQVKADEAQLERTRAGLESSKVALAQTVITAPVDGIVIARNVDVGQTLVSKMQAQTLFEIAADLSKMQVNASIDESDVGRVHPGQSVTFTVEAYPDRPFSATVRQVRLNPSIDQNVVSYIAVIEVSNPGFELRPGMTANVTIRVDSRDDVLRVPTGALLFRPDAELFAKLHQSAPSSELAKLAVKARAGSGLVWVFRDGRLTGVAVKTGLGDGTNTEVESGNLHPGDVVVTNVVGS